MVDALGADGHVVLHELRSFLQEALGHDGLLLELCAHACCLPEVFLQFRVPLQLLDLVLGVDAHFEVLDVFEVLLGHERELLEFVCERYDLGVVGDKLGVLLDRVLLVEFGLALVELLLAADVLDELGLLHDPFLQLLLDW